MAKRYGRRQKRAQTQRIAELEEALEMSQKLCRYISDKHEALRDEVEAWDKEIQQLLGRYTAFQFKTPTVVDNWKIDRLPVPLSLKQLRRFAEEAGKGDAGREIFADKVEASAINIKRFIALIESHDVDFLNTLVRVHLVNETEGKRITSYGLSEEMVRQTAFTERDCRILAHMIANKMVAFLNREQEKRRASV